MAMQKILGNLSIAPYPYQPWDILTKKGLIRISVLCIMEPLQTVLSLIAYTMNLPSLKVTGSTTQEIQKQDHPHLSTIVFSISH